MNINLLFLVNISALKNKRESTCPINVTNTLVALITHCPPPLLNLLRNLCTYHALLSGICLQKVTAHYWEEELEPYSYTCNNAWPSETMSIIYSVYLFLLLFFVPLLIVSYAYMRIACHLNSTRERSSGESNGSPFNRPGKDSSSHTAILTVPNTPN